MLVMPSNRSSIATCLWKKPTVNGIADPRRKKCDCLSEHQRLPFHVCTNVDSFSAFHLPEPLSLNQGCQMVCFQTKYTHLGKFWRAFDGKMFIYLMAIWNILQAFGIFYGVLVDFVFIW
jgi:hypothetical protein